MKNKILELLKSIWKSSCVRAWARARARVCVCVEATGNAYVRACAVCMWVYAHLRKGMCRPAVNTYNEITLQDNVASPGRTTICCCRRHDTYTIYSRVSQVVCLSTQEAPFWENESVRFKLNSGTTVTSIMSCCCMKSPWKTSGITTASAFFF